MVLNDPKNNSNPAIFIRSFFREQLLVFPAAVGFFGIMVRTCMEWADPAVHHHGILGCRRVVFVQTQGKRNRSALVEKTDMISDYIPSYRWRYNSTTYEQWMLEDLAKSLQD